MPTIEREDLRKEVLAVAKELGSNRSSLIPLLQAVQARYGYVSEHAMQDIADAIGISPVEVQSVATFYHLINTEPTGRFVIRVSSCTPCMMAGAERIMHQFENELGIEVGETTTDGVFTVEWTSCIGMCDQGPAVLVNDSVYTFVTPEKVYAIITECRKAFSGLGAKANGLIPNKRNSGPILEGVSAPNAALKKALGMKRVDVIAELRDSNLRGRGGAGFPTSLKWQLAAAASDPVKFVVCNADEGEPGTFKDRLLLTEYIDTLLEGMTIGGYAIGANTGVIYLRAEYTFMKAAIEAAIEKRHTEKLLGEKILGKDFNFDIHLHMGAGAYVCGEETALIESLEGKRGEPRNRPPFPVDTGLNGHPTIVNNVETFIDAALIVDRGAAWWKQYGTEKSSGTKLFSVSGDCDKPGIYEFAWGLTVNDLLKQVGGEGAKAVQIGGASGTCVPAKDFGRKICFEDVPTGGSIMVFDHDRDMLEIAENFLEFFVEESCGKCVPCRKGCPTLLRGVEELLDGKGSVAYLNKLKSLAETMQCSCVCGLGQSAPNAFLSIIANFSDEVLGR